MHKECLQEDMKNTYIHSSCLYVYMHGDTYTHAYVMCVGRREKCHLEGTIAICVYISAHTRTLYMCGYMYVSCMCVYMYVCMYVCIYVCVYVCMYISTHKNFDTPRPKLLHTTCLHTYTTYGEHIHYIWGEHTLHVGNTLRAPNQECASNPLTEFPCTHINLHTHTPHVFM